MITVRISISGRSILMKFNILMQIETGNHMCIFVYLILTLFQRYSHRYYFSQSITIGKQENKSYLSTWTLDTNEIQHTSAILNRESYVHILIFNINFVSQIQSQILFFIDKLQQKNHESSSYLCMWRIYFNLHTSKVFLHVVNSKWGVDQIIYKTIQSL